MVHGLNFNLLLQARTFSWLTVPRADALLAPLSSLNKVVANNAWKHAYVVANKSQRVAVTIQSADYSAATLAALNTKIKVGKRH
ncbi:hypothetical protein H632_c1800p0 [Helicosporidium sp. ATCC 50920]|nr:hypothetical protein H632_c1800p0 [Helicosporidium sp. ATCC 50920]|eukprot:KDD73833.1 hypothetical protein H632_c1800p0 [Helicosporidium sp. ATCC 50920]